MNTRQSTNSQSENRPLGTYDGWPGGPARVCLLPGAFVVDLPGHFWRMDWPPDSIGSLQPVFLGAAVLALALAWRRIWRPTQVCEPGQIRGTSGQARLPMAVWLGRGPDRSGAGVPIHRALVLLKSTS